MAVSLNQSIKSPSGTTLITTNPHTFTHTNTGLDATKGIVVVIVSGMGTTGNDVVTGVTYSGVAMTRVRSDVVTAGDEPGRTYIYFLGSNVDPGLNPDISIAKTDTTGTWAVCMTFTADEDLIVQDHDGISGVIANPSVTLQDPGARAGIAVAVLYSGQGSTASVAIPSDLSGSQRMQPLLQSIDVGLQVAVLAISGQTHGPVICGWNATAEDAALSVALVGESTSIQIARPDSTIQGARSLDGATRHGAMSDQSDDTYISGISSTDDIFTLSNVTDPGGNENYSLWVRGNGTSGTGTGTIELWQGNPLSGGTLISASSGMPATTYADDKEFALLDTEVDVITDFNNLYVVYDKTSGTASKTLQEIFFETPGLLSAPEAWGMQMGIAPPFGPLSLVGCKAWWDFSDISTLWQNSGRSVAITADAQTIGGVTDKSSAANHLLQSTSTAEPAYKTGIINGRSVGRFDGTSDYMAASMPADSSWTLFIVAKKATAPTATTDTLFGTNSTNAYFATHSTLTTSYFWQFNQAGGYPVLSATPTNTNVLVLRIASASSMGIYQNGGSPGQFDPNDDITTITTYYLGNNGGTDYGDYDIGEVIAYDTALLVDDLNLVGQYLATKWGTTWTTATVPAIPFSPLDIAGCNAWWDFADLSTLYQDDQASVVVTADGQTLGSVMSKAAGGWLLAQATTSYEPTYKTSIINGRSVARFDGIDNWLSAETWPADTSRTVFIVAQKRSAIDTNLKTLLAMDVDAQLYTRSSDSATAYVWDRNSAQNNIPVGGTPTNVTCMVLRVNSAASLFVHANGGSPATFDPDDVLTTATEFRLGSSVSGTFHGDYDVGEIVAYDTSLSVADLNSVGTYLATKWGFTWTTITA